MAKRRLSRQQKSRISKRQQLEVDQGQDDAREENLSGPRMRGIITCNYGQQLEVETTEPDQTGTLFRCFQRSNLPPLVCGDRVVFVAGEDTDGVIVGQEPRNSVFSRPGASGQLKPVAANVDLVLVVLAPRPQPFLNLLDRYLVAIENLRLRPIIIINKSDLPREDSDAVLAGVEALYPDLGYPLFTVSADRGLGLAKLRAELHSRTAVVVGQSGVGKSSLINALSPGTGTRVGPLSTAADKGTHTTTAARLFHLDEFDLIDSPGIREFALWHISPDELLNGFVEFRPFLGHCRFRDCSHQGEPGCALQDAANSGKIKGSRLASYFQILSSLNTS